MAKNNRVFQRVEKKYLLTASAALALAAGLKEHMEPDAYGKHTIINIYYDTPDFELIRRSLDRPQYKEKLRMRSYGVPREEDRVFVELKKKVEGVVYKRRAAMTLAEAERYLNGGKKPRENGQIIQEIDYAVNFYGAQPMMAVAYDRIALTCPEDPEFRVTFDRAIRYRTGELSLGRGAYGRRILGEDQALMEVKTLGAFPLWFSRLLSQNKIYPTTFSKYGKAYAHMRKTQQEGRNVA